MSHPQLMIVAGEASGDLHGANLVRALRLQCPGITLCGMGGPELEKAGVEILYDASKISVMGFFEVISRLKDIFKAQVTLRKRLESQRPDLLIVIDLPDFNLPLARKAKKLGIPVFYYITPKVWAWRSGRVKTIKKLVDKLGVILPFEKKYFLERGVEAEYVGHPLLDSVKTQVGREAFLTSLHIPQNSTCVGLLPGSRSREVASLLPVFLQAAELLVKSAVKPLVFLVPQASTITEDDFRLAGLFDSKEKVDIRVVNENRYDMMAACDVVVAASGTVTLELALLEIPMLVVYKVAPLTYRLGKLLIKLEHFSLVNLIAEREVVTELLQDEVQPERIATKLTALLEDDSKRDEMICGLREVKEKMGQKGASQKAANVALECMNTKMDAY